MDFYEQFKNILEEMEIKYLFDKDNKTFKVDLTSRCETFEVNIAFFKNLNLVTFIIPKAVKIQTEKRKKIKNFILDFNFKNIYGSFAIVKNSKFVSYSHSHSLGRTNQSLINKEQIEDYFGYFAFIIPYVRDKISKLGENHEQK